MNTDTGRTVRAGMTTLILGMAVVIAGCSDSAVGPEETGAVEAYMRDQPADAQGSSHYAGEYSTSENASEPTESQYSGSLTTQARVAISADGQAWVDLGPPSSASVQLQSSGEGIEVHGEVHVPVGTYTRVRLVLDGAQATLQTGSTIGGVTLTGTATMTLGANGSVTIEKTVPPFEIRADARTRVTWDMNSHLWVNQENAEEEEVEEEEVQDAAEPRTDSEARDTGDLS